MPYTPRQVQYLNAMGLVPWTLRASNTDSTGRDTSKQNPSEPNPQTVQAVQPLSAGDCPLLLVFCEPASESGPALSAAENRLLLDMFAAIKLGDASVARRQIEVNLTTDASQAIAPFLSESVKAVLVLDGDEHGVSSDDEVASRLLADALKVPVWRLPHPARIQAQPLLKRRAWNVLKAARRALQADVLA